MTTRQSRAQTPRILQVALAFLGVVHRADLTGQQARAALFLVPGGGHVLATERQRRSGHVRDLAQQPCANHPRQTRRADEET